MSDYKLILLEEQDYLKETISEIKKEIDFEKSNLAGRRRELVKAGRDMWEESVHFSNDIMKMTEVSQYLSDYSAQTGTYRVTAKRARILGKMLENPYFGRVDIIEEGLKDPEKIYIGIGSLTQRSTGKIYVYDWRSPVSSIFYRYEPGKASYSSPAGEIPVEVILKRQYKIEKEQLKYFFDCSMRINDEILQDVLGRNASENMRNIVETIQKEQDFVIRDRDNELLVVQGVAGSGKSSIALHRVAFLLYEGMNSGLGSNNIIIISPNAVFSKYISGVLPELGEENVREATVEELIEESLGKGIQVQARNLQLEEVVSGCGGFISRCIEFKGSAGFADVLDRLVSYYEHKVICFEDVYFGGAVLETRQQLRNMFLSGKLNVPPVKRLHRLEERIMNKIHPLRKKRLGKIEELVQKSEGHDIDIKAFSRLLSIKEARQLSNRVQRFSRMDYMEMYRRLFSDKALFIRLTDGIQVPEDIDEIMKYTVAGIDDGQLRYEDAVAIFYLKLRLEGAEGYEDIRQVVIDEAQDYYPMHYKIFALLFPDARFTVTGDIYQSVERPVDLSIYDGIEGILKKKRSARLTLKRSYRSSFEISSFSGKILRAEQELIPFERHEAQVNIMEKTNSEEVEKELVKELGIITEMGYASAAIICKTRKEAKALYERLKGYIEIKLSDQDGSAGGWTVILSAYEAKGLEFDAVIVPDASDSNYNSELDKRLLYIACTRALHRLSIYSAGQRSTFINAAF